MAEGVHFLGIGFLAWKLMKKKNAGGGYVQLLLLLCLLLSSISSQHQCTAPPQATNWIHLILLSMHNRKMSSYLAAIHRLLVTGLKIAWPSFHVHVHVLCTVSHNHHPRLVSDKGTGVAGLSLKTQELTAVFLAIRLYCRYSTGPSGRGSQTMSVTPCLLLSTNLFDGTCGCLSVARPAACAVS
jgi:hypothetical protein